MTTEKIKGVYKNVDFRDKEFFLKEISESLKVNNKIMSCLLTILFFESNFKSITSNEIEKIMPSINEALKTIHKNIYDK